MSASEFRGDASPFGLRKQIHAILPIVIFISPYLALNDDNTIAGAPDATPAIVDMLSPAVPPQYGAHHFDQLYSQVEPSGYMTPAGDSSGFNTPFASTSRSASVDDLVSAGGQAPRGWVANILQIRLEGLGAIPGQGHLSRCSDAEGSASRRAESVPPAVDTSSAADAPLPVNTPLPVDTLSAVETPLAIRTSPAVNRPMAVTTQLSVELPSTASTLQTVSTSATVNTGPAGADVAATASHTTPEHIEFSTEALSKVPSYRTARNSRPPVLIHDGLPNYESALHAPIVIPVVTPPNPSEAGPSGSHRPK